MMVIFCPLFNKPWLSASPLFVDYSTDVDTHSWLSSSEPGKAALGDLRRLFVWPARI